MTLYDGIGHSYAQFRRPDPRIASAIEAALGDARSVVNIGAGAGSYEPLDRTVIAVEPSEVMIRQRPAGAAPCRQGSAEALPLETKSVDAAMTVLSAHHWTDLERGLSEMARVARKRAVLFTWVPDAVPFWLVDDYFPEMHADDRRIFPSAINLAEKMERLVGPVQMTTVLIPHDCTDTYRAYWRRPECYLNPDIRSSMSAFAWIDAEAGLAKLRADLSNGRWAEHNRHLLTLDELDLGYRIVCSEIRGKNS